MPILLKCQHCGKEYQTKPYMREKSKHCSRICHNQAIGVSKTSELTLIRRSQLILDPEDEYLRNKTIFNSIGRPYIQTPNGPKQMTGIGRALMVPPDDMVVDHINRNFMDNRKENLRVCSITENMNNKGETRKRNKKNEHIPTGVIQDGNKFYAIIFRRENGKIKGTRLGSFDCPIEAAEEYRKARFKRSGLTEKP